MSLQLFVIDYGASNKYEANDGDDKQTRKKKPLDVGLSCWSLAKSLNVARTVVDWNDLL
jgi:hypothetical protein